MSMVSYSPHVLDHFLAPRNVVDDDNVANWCYGEAGSIEQGRWLKFFMRAQDHKVEQLKFQAYGCPHTLAIASWLSEALVGQAFGDILPLDQVGLSRHLDLPQEKLACILLAEDALTQCLPPNKNHSNLTSGSEPKGSDPMS